MWLSYRNTMVTILFFYYKCEVSITLYNKVQYNINQNRDKNKIRCSYLYVVLFKYDYDFIIQYGQWLVIICYLICLYFVLNFKIACIMFLFPFEQDVYSKVQPNLVTCMTIEENHG